MRLDRDVGHALEVNVPGQHGFVDGGHRCERQPTNSSNLSWIDPLPLDDPAARETAVIETELLESGDRINLGDVLIAGICRRHGARIVTGDSHFDRVDGLEVDDHREQFDA